MAKAKFGDIEFELREIKAEMQDEAEAAFGTHKVQALMADLTRFTILWPERPED